LAPFCREVCASSLLDDHLLSFRPEKACLNFFPVLSLSRFFFNLAQCSLVKTCA
jgi:hypothetical protein